MYIIDIADNESQGGSAVQAYFQLLEQAYRDNGIVVPLTYNDPGQRKNFVNGTVSIDLFISVNSTAQKNSGTRRHLWV